MKSRAILVPIVFALLALRSYSQGAYTISGKIFDSAHAQQLGGASIRVKGSNQLTVSKEDGSFELKVFQRLPITLLVSYVGYQPQEFLVSDNNASAVSVSLYAQNQYAGQVIVSASRVSESILK